MMSEVTAQLSRIERSLGRIEGKADALAEKVAAHIERDDRLHADMIARLSKIEHAQSYASGRHSVIGTVFGLIGGGIATWAARTFS